MLARLYIEQHVVIVLPNCDPVCSDHPSSVPVLSTTTAIGITDGLIPARRCCPTETLTRFHSPRLRNVGSWNAVTIEIAQDIVTRFPCGLSPTQEVQNTAEAARLVPGLDGTTVVC